MFQTIAGDPYTFFESGDTICITTNGITKKKDQTAVMGKGTAEFAQVTFKEYEIDKLLGRYLILHKNRAFYLGEYTFPLVKGFEQSEGKKVHLVTFPTKNHWRDKSDIYLIRESIAQLQIIQRKFNLNKRIYLPMPGCGAGQLKWSDVKEDLSVLDEKYIIYSKTEEDFIF